MPVSRTATTPRRIITRTLGLGLSALIAAGLLTWSPAVTTGWNQGSAEATLWQLLNGARVNNGMAPLQQHSTLIGLARWRSSDMLAQNYFSHTIAGWWECLRLLNPLALEVCYGIIGIIGLKALPLLKLFGSDLAAS